MRIGVLGVVGLSLLTAACGTTMQQRAATGGITGGGVGALVGGPVGFLVGAVVGAGGGAVMPEGADQIAINGLGITHRVAQNTLNSVGLGSGTATAQASGAPGATASAASTAGSGSTLPPPAVIRRSAVVKEAQVKLKQDGLYHGRIDGIIGPQTRRALTDFQKREDLPQTAALDQQTLQKLNISEPRAQANESQHRQNAQTNERASSGSSASAGGMMSEDQVRSRLESDGYSNVNNLHQVNNNTYAAEAAKGGQTYKVQVDAQSGRIVAQQPASAATGNEGSSANPAAGPSSPPPASESGSGAGSPPAGSAGSGNGSAPTSPGNTGGAGR
jgi:peptidoglycan hydrolase-like protein with peptidoglycan-binding domain